MKKLISIAIPVFNEELAIPKLISSLSDEADKLTQYNFEMIMVENGSIDNSAKLLIEARKKDKRFKILQLAKNVGCDEGIIAGLSFAKGDAALVMMADLQEDPALINQFINKWLDGYDVVYGIVKKREGTKLTRKIGTYLFYRIINLITRGSLPQNVSDFRLLDRKVYQAVVAMPEHNKFFRGLVSWTGFKQIGIPFKRKKRVAGKSKANLLNVITVATNGVFSFSDLPLKLPLIIGVISFVISLLVISKLQNVAFILLLFSLVMFVFYIQNEYFKRVFDEVRNRPSFIVKNKYGIE